MWPFEWYREPVTPEQHRLIQVNSYVATGLVYQANGFDLEALAERLSRG